MRDRVAVVHDQARPTLTLAASFGIVAAATTLIPHRTGLWLPLHLFFTGALVLAISGASQLFAVTWSAGVPAPGPLVTGQRWAAAAGAAGIAAGRELGAPAWAVAGAGALLGISLTTLGALLTYEVRAGRVRRFDPFLRYYQAAAASGIAGVILGVGLAHGTRSWREAHVVLTALGLVGLTIAGTLPFFAATQVRTRMSRRAIRPRLHAGLLGLAAGVALSAAAALAGRRVLVAIGLSTYAAALAYVTSLVPVPGSKQWRWAGPRAAQLALGLVWWEAVVVGDAIRSFGGEPALTERSLAVLAVGGYLQILLGSLAYLVPVLLGGGHHRLAVGFRATRSWPSLVALNLAALGVLAGRPALTAVGLGTVVADTATRAALLRLKSTVAPDEPPSPGATEAETGERLGRHALG